MKKLNTYITEKFKISNDINIKEKKYFPQNRKELIEIIESIIYKERKKGGITIDFNCIDTSKIDDMHFLFKDFSTDLLDCNLDVSSWDVSNVNDMNHMFSDCTYFDCNLSNWDISKVTDMSFMFAGCESLSVKNIETWNWNLKNVESTEYMFSDCDEDLNDTILKLYFSMKEENRDTSMFTDEDYFDENYNDPYLSSENNHFIITIKGNKIKDIDSKYKYALVLGDTYCGHMKGFGLYNDQAILRFMSDTDSDWDLPEIVFGKGKKNLENLIEDIENDSYFRDYNGWINDDIYTIQAIKKSPVKVYG